MYACIGSLSNWDKVISKIIYELLKEITLRFKRSFHKKIIFRMLDRGGGGIFSFSLPIRNSALKGKKITLIKNFNENDC